MTKEEKKAFKDLLDIVVDLSVRTNIKRYIIDDILQKVNDLRKYIDAQKDD